MFMLLGEKVNEHFPDLLGCQIGIHLKGKKTHYNPLISGRVLCYLEFYEYDLLRLINSTMSVQDPSKSLKFLKNVSATFTTSD